MYVYLYTHLNIYIFYATEDGDESRLEHIILKGKKQLMKCACSRPSFGGNCPFGIHVKNPKHWKILSSMNISGIYLPQIVSMSILAKQSVSWSCE